MHWKRCTQHILWFLVMLVMRKGARKIKENEEQNLIINDCGIHSMGSDVGSIMEVSNLMERWRASVFKGRNIQVHKY